MPQPAGGVHAGPAGDPRAELQQLSDELDAKRKQMDLSDSAVASAMVQPVAPNNRMAQPPLSSKTDATCHPAPSDTCTTTCTLADDICDKSARICTLADQLTDDADAHAKCDRGRSTCSAAHAKCCSCQQ